MRIKRELALKGVLSHSPLQKGVFDTRVRPFTNQTAIPCSVKPNKGETAVHGFYCPSDMVVRMRKVLAILWSSLAKNV